MATSSHYPHQNSSPRALAMVLALVSALVLSPLYVDHRKSESRLETRWSSGGLVLPAVVAGLIVAIRTTTSSSSSNGLMRKRGDNYYHQSDVDNSAGLVFRVGSSCWGLAGILIMLVFVVSWQDSVQHFFWR
ncbi:hypothetical protein BUALT_Bualt07G0164600 [Buddleja alternifolia]|uniref:Uncharacterized protein n=1 Tax=Buddleja alternifolia TaxID=168488 RepID=A0AAV6XM66_9LAMI|nr:hypothetical protein BUALT_Bualt07G0164600 [Buddleja alternifolia]